MWSIFPWPRIEKHTKCSLTSYDARSHTVRYTISYRTIYDLTPYDKRLAKHSFRKDNARRPRRLYYLKNAILRPANFVLPTICIIFAANSGFYNHFAK